MSVRSIEQEKFYLKIYQNQIYVETITIWSCIKKRVLSMILPTYFGRYQLIDIVASECFKTFVKNLDEISKLHLKQRIIEPMINKKKTIPQSVLDLFFPKVVHLPIKENSPLANNINKINKEKTKFLLNELSQLFESPPFNEDKGIPKEPSRKRKREDSVQLSQTHATFVSSGSPPISLENWKKQIHQILAHHLIVYPTQKNKPSEQEKEEFFIKAFQCIASTFFESKHIDLIASPFLDAMNQFLNTTFKNPWIRYIIFEFFFDFKNNEGEIFKIKIKNELEKLARTLPLTHSSIIVDKESKKLRILSILPNKWFGFNISNYSLWKTPEKEMIQTILLKRCIEEKAKEPKVPLLVEILDTQETAIEDHSAYLFPLAEKLANEKIFICGGNGLKTLLPQNPYCLKREGHQYFIKEGVYFSL